MKRVLLTYLALLGYLRTIFKTYFLRERKPGVSVLLTKPKDLDYEIFIMQKYQEFCKHLLSKKESRTGALEEDLTLIKNWQELGLSFPRKMAVVYRSEKKKILHTNIDLCGYLLKILKYLKEKKEEKKQVKQDEYRKLCLERTDLEQQPGLFKRWVHNGDAIFSEEDEYFRRRLGLRAYLKDLAELVGIPTQSDDKP